MACGSCGGGAQQFEQMRALDYSAARVDGTYRLETYPDCVGGYRGKFEGRSVFAVARNTPGERLFASDDASYREAIEYMNSFGVSNRPTIERLPVSMLCPLAIEALYG